MKWIVLVPQGIFTKCYGLFDSHDACMVWARANQFDVHDVQAHAVNRDETEPSSQCSGCEHPIDFHSSIGCGIEECGCSEALY